MNGFNPLITVIIPIYNAEKYLQSTINSVLSQTYAKFELILVDDGSTDNSLKISTGLADTDKRLLLIKQPNSGANFARMSGVINSSGQYICFLDADDTLPKDALESYLKILKAKNYDIVCAQKRYHHFGGKVKIGGTSKKYGNIDRDIYIKQLLNLQIAGGPHGKLFNRKLFDNDTFNLSKDVILHEDLMMNLRLALNAELIFLSDKILYNYLYNSDSLSNNAKYNLNQFCILFDTMDNAFNSLKHRSHFEQSLTNFRYTAIYRYFIKRKISIDFNSVQVKKIADYNKLWGLNIKSIFTLFYLNSSVFRHITNLSIDIKKKYL